MLRHFSVAYIESFRFVFYNSFTWRTVQSASSGSVHPHPNQSRIVRAVVVDIQYNFDSRNEDLVAIQPVNKLPVMIITAPTKTLQEVDQFGKRKMSVFSQSLWEIEAIPALFRGVGHIETEDCDRLVADLLVPGTVATAINLQSGRAKQYFHKARKDTFWSVCIKQTLGLVLLLLLGFFLL